MKFTAVLIFFISFIAAFPAEPLFQPFNLDMEEVDYEGLPLGWGTNKFTSSGGYHVGASDKEPYDGKYSLMISNRSGMAADSLLGVAFQSVDALPYRGKKVRFYAMLRGDNNDSAYCGIWIQQHLPEGESDNTRSPEDLRVTLKWQPVMVELEISEAALYINFGMLTSGNADAYIDGCRFEIANDYLKPEPAATLTDEQVASLHAFTRLYSLLKFYHPSPEASYLTDWESLIYRGVKKFETVRKDKLKQELEDFFRPLAPALKLYSSEKEAKKYSYEVPAVKDYLEGEALSWIHRGIYSEYFNEEFYSSKANLYIPQKKREAVAMTIIDAGDMRNDSVIVMVSAKIKQGDFASHGQIWLRADRGEGAEPMTATMSRSPIESSEWQRYSFGIRMPADATRLRVGLVMIGSGAIWFDNMEVVKIDSLGQAYGMGIDGLDFEYPEANGLPKNWQVPKSVESAGYSVKVTDKDKVSGTRSLIMESTENGGGLSLPSYGETVTTQLSDNIYAAFPINVVTTQYKGQSPIPAGEKVMLHHSDRISRIGVAAFASGLSDQFSPGTFDMKESAARFGKAVRKAAVDTNVREFTSTLQASLKPFADGQLRIWQGNATPRYTLPFLWKRIGNELVITDVIPIYGIEKGDRVVKISGIETEKYIKEKAAAYPDANPEWTALRVLAELRIGNRDERVDLSILTRDGFEKELSFYKDAYYTELREKGIDPLTQLEGSNICYVNLAVVGDADVKDILDKMTAFDGIVFDARGSARMSEHFLGFFLKDSIENVEWKIPVYTRPDKKAVQYTTIGGHITPLKTELTKNIVFLCDESSVGYSEPILHLVKSHKIARIIGRESAGAPGEVAAVRLPGEYYIAVNTLQGYVPGVGKINGKRVAPDITVAASKTDALAGRDTVLEKAVEILKNNRKLK